jgi:DNA-binding protein YbaB
LNPENLYQWVEEYEAKLSGPAQKSQDLEAGVAASTATASSRNNAVKVTVGPNGGLQNLVLDHRAVELGAPRLAALILETSRQAQKEVARKVLEVFKPLGEGTESYRMAAGAVPGGDEPEEIDLDDEEYENQPW